MRSPPHPEPMLISSRSMSRALRSLRCNKSRRPYSAVQAKEWLDRLRSAVPPMRAEALLAELDVLQELRPRAKAAMIIETLG
jgi:hypothetical protein